jgi:hypothetical protein
VVAERFPAICGSATFATEESSTTMKVASITDTAIIHGFAEGLHSIGPAAAVGGVLPGMLIQLSPDVVPWDECRRR